MKIWLMYHSPTEWADVRADQARALGCSPEYCERLRAQVLADAQAEGPAVKLR